MAFSEQLKRQTGKIKNTQPNDKTTLKNKQTHRWQFQNTFEHYYISEQYYVLHLDTCSLPFLGNSGREIQRKT